MNSSQSRLMTDHERIAMLEDALHAIRRIVFNSKGGRRKAIVLINEVVGEGLYGDFPGTIDQVERDLAP